MSSTPDHSGVTFTPTLRHDIYTAINPLEADLSQTGKTVLVTGAGRGIGRAIALRYAEAGVARLILLARTLKELDEVEKEIHAIKKDIHVLKLSVDISSKEAIAKAVEAFQNSFDKLEEAKLDVLVNNAGLSDPWVPILEGDSDLWWHTWEVSIQGTYLMMKAFLPFLIETAAARGNSTSIVNISSIGALVVSPGASAYQSSRLAMLRLGEFVAAEYGDKGVNVVSLHPGGVKTRLSDGNLPDIVLVDAPELCGGFVVWLTKEDRTWLNGRYLSATWDVTELEGKRDEIEKGDKLKVKLVV